MYKFRVILNLIVSIAGVVFSVLDIINRSNTNLIIISVSLIISIILQMKYDGLQPSGFFTYIIAGVIGGIFLRPFLHGFFIVNNLLDFLFTIFPLLFKRRSF